MTDPNNPYLNATSAMIGSMPQKPQQAPPAGMDPAKFQRQQQRTAIQNDRAAGQNMMGAPPLQTLQAPGVEMGKMFNSMSAPPMMSDPMGGPPPGGDPLMNTHFPGGPPQAINPTQPGPVSAPAQVPPSPDPRQVLPTGPGLGAPAQKPQGFNPRQMIRATGQARGTQMERMARPTGARQGLAQAKATGNLPGGPPKPPAAY